MTPKKIETYDATLRDGMQGEGMSLTAAEKVRVVRRAGRARRRPDRGRLPRLQPQGPGAVRAARGRALAHSQIAAFGMTRRRDVAAEDDPALQILAECFAPVCTIVGKTWRLHLEKVVAGERGGEPES